MKRKRHGMVALLFLVGLVGALILSILWTRPSSDYYYAPTSISEPSEPVDSSQASPIPVDPPFFPQSSPAPTLEPSQLESAEAAIDRALSKLPQGEVYHNVPETMKVNRAAIIEAGIAPTVTEQIQQELQGSGEIQIESGVRFDPGGMEMKLIVQPDEFEVLEVRGGKQFVTGTTPGQWVWQVTPLTAGDHLMVIKAIVDLKVPELDVTRAVEVEVFRATRSVQVNPVYSARTFVAQNWTELLGLVIGSGSVASAVTWWMGRKPKAAG